MEMLDSLLEPFSQCLNAESALKVSNFRVDDTLQARMAFLAERANEGLLSEDEHQEYSSLVNAADFISIIKLKAGQHLQAHRA